MMAEAANMMISMVCAMPIGSPSNTGRSDGTAPISTTSRAAPTKMATEVFAVGLSGPSSVSEVISRLFR